MDRWRKFPVGSIVAALEVDNGDELTGKRVGTFCDCWQDVLAVG